MNFLEIQNSVAAYLDDLQFGYFTPTQVKLWINLAQKEVQKRLIKAGQNYYVKCVQTTLVLNQRDYVLPDDFKKLHRLEVVTSGTAPNEICYPITAITINQKDFASTQTGTPGVYYIRRNRITVFPAPDSTLTMRMQYSYEVTDMVNDTDIPDVPEAYHELIALLAAEDGFIKDGRSSDLLQKKLKKFEEDMDSDANERAQDGPRGIVETGWNDGGYSY